MEDQAIRLFIKFKIRPGQLGEFRRIAEELSTSTEAREPLAQSYEWFLNEDQSECWLSERYPDSESLVQHIGHVIHRLKNIMEISDVTELLILGSPSEELRKWLAPMGAKVLERFSGFCR